VLSQWGLRIELPKFRDANGLLRSAVVLPEEVRAISRYSSSRR
jgi:hypothetical protein